MTFARPFRRPVPCLLAVLFLSLQLPVESGLRLIGFECLHHPDGTAMNRGDRVEIHPEAVRLEAAEEIGAVTVPPLSLTSFYLQTAPED